MPSVPKDNMAWSPRIACMRPRPFINSAPSSPHLWLNPSSCCAPVCLGLFFFFFFRVSHKLLGIHSLRLASLVSIQHPMYPGPIHHPQGNGDGTAMPGGSGERGATAAFWNWSRYVWVSCISFILNGMLCCLCRAQKYIRQMGKGTILKHP